MEPDLALFHITLKLPVVESGPTLLKLGSGGHKKPREMTVLFPMTSEDPVAGKRQGAALGEVSWRGWC